MEDEDAEIYDFKIGDYIRFVIDKSVYPFRAVYRVKDVGLHGTIGAGMRKYVEFVFEGAVRRVDAECFAPWVPDVGDWIDGRGHYEAGRVTKFLDNGDTLCIWDVELKWTIGREMAKPVIGKAPQPVVDSATDSYKAAQVIYVRCKREIPGYELRFKVGAVYKTDKLQVELDKQLMNNFEYWVPRAGDWVESRVFDNDKAPVCSLVHLVHKEDNIWQCFNEENNVYQHARGKDLVPVLDRAPLKSPVPAARIKIPALSIDTSGPATVVAPVGERKFHIIDRTTDDVGSPVHHPDSAKKFFEANDDVFGGLTYPHGQKMDADEAFWERANYYWRCQQDTQDRLTGGPKLKGLMDFTTEEQREVDLERMAEIENNMLWERPNMADQHAYRILTEDRR